jgi:uncharacterized protein (UPF0212 family)
MIDRTVTDLENVGKVSIHGSVYCIFQVNVFAENDEHAIKIAADKFRAAKCLAQRIGV